MHGDKKNNKGLIPLSIAEIFDFIKNDTERSYKVSVSYMEIYNECVNDLMNPANKNLDVREGISGICINKLSEKAVSGSEEVLSLM